MGIRDSHQRNALRHGFAGSQMDHQSLSRVLPREDLTPSLAPPITSPYSPMRNMEYDATEPAASGGQQLRSGPVGSASGLASAATATTVFGGGGPRVDMHIPVVSERWHLQGTWDWLDCLSSAAVACESL